MNDLVQAANQAYTEGDLEGIDTQIVGAHLIKRAHTDIEARFLQNEARFLEALAGSGFAPKLINLETARLTVEYLGQSEPVTDETIFRRNCIKLLDTLRLYGIHHGDITAKNVIVKDNKPMLVDFHQSRFAAEPGRDKRLEGDAYWLWKTALELSPDGSRHIRKWQAIRPHLTQNGTLYDVGCAAGDYLLMAQAEGIYQEAWGIDRDLRGVLFEDVLGEDLGVSVSVEACDDILFMSVYAHIAREYGQEKADLVLATLAKRSAQLFFETQLEGDGPGVHKTDDDVYKMLKAHGAVEKLATIPVGGREPYTRSVWRVV